jgi:hypothetical protein
MRESEPRVLVCLFDLAVWTLKTTNRFPRNWRVSVGDKLDCLVVEMVLLAQKARFRKEKLPLLKELSENLESLRLLTRLAVELGCLEGRQREYVAKQIDEIGKQLGGWIKQQAGA